MAPGAATSGLDLTPCSRVSPGEFDIVSAWSAGPVVAARPDRAARRATGAETQSKADVRSI
jgi:hypothetical protein